MISCMQLIRRFSIFAGHFMFYEKVLPLARKNFANVR